MASVTCALGHQKASRAKMNLTGYSTQVIFQPLLRKEVGGFITEAAVQASRESDLLSKPEIRGRNMQKRLLRYTASWVWYGSVLTLGR